MKLREIAEELDLQTRGTASNPDAEITRGYVSDLLSDVLACGREGDVWVTLQTHPNIVAVASIRGVSAILLVNGREPEEKTLARANEESMPIFVSNMAAFELVGRLYSMGISGSATGRADA